MKYKLNLSSFPPHIIIALCLLIFFWKFSGPLYCQTSAVKGVVTDKETGETLPFVSVVVKNSLPVRGTVTDTSGAYTIDRLKPGRYTLQFSCIGYKEYIAAELLVFTGKELQQDIALEPIGYKTGEVVIQANKGNKEAGNSMALLSARSISIEEASRFAGGYDDPARLVTAFAGIGGGLQSNAISVRGNAPGYLQWKLEGAEIPNPNHFADLSVFGGGGLTALSANLIKSSDFFTGAFPAEYGNALSGVFDLQMRPGNASKYEHTFQAGLAGIELSSEGPLNTNGASYLASYRYSALALLAPLLPEDAGATKYQDASFKFHLPLSSNAIVGIWGIGLADKSGQKIEKDSAQRRYLQDYRNQDASQNTVAAGVNAFLTGGGQYLRLSGSFSLNETKIVSEQLYQGKGVLPLSNIYNGWKSYDVSAMYNAVMSPGLVLRTGLSASFKYSRPELQSDTSGNGIPVVISSGNNTSLLSLGFFSLSYQPNPIFQAVAGLNVQHFKLNRKISVEPRISAAVQSVFGKFTAGYGEHSRIELMQYYFIKDADGNEVNKSLDFTHARHFIVGWQYQVSNEIVVKAESYLQQLYSVPVAAAGTFSVLNNNDWFLSKKLYNNGTGKNTGIEFTLEKELSDSWYALTSLSFFKSVYTGADGITRNTKYNRSYIINCTAGKEWLTGENNTDIVALGVRLLWQGGERYSALNTPASIAVQDLVYDESQPFSMQYPAGLFLHFNASYRINTKSGSHEIALKILNITGRKEEQGYDLNPKTGETTIRKELLILPNLSYKYWF